MFGRIKYAWAKRKMRSSARELGRSARKSGDVLLRKMILMSAGSPEPTDRMSGAISLGELGRTDDVGRLASLLNDEYLIVAVEAARALGKIGDLTAIPALEAARAKADLDVRVKLAAIKAMTSIYKAEKARRESAA